MDIASTLTWITIAGAGNQPMGLQRYELETLGALRALSSDWSFEHRSVSSLRADAPPDIRLPIRPLAALPAWAARGVGGWAYRGAARVHRFDLRLPPPRVPEVVTVHDLPPLRFSDEGRLPRWSVATARRARLVICPSHFAAAEARELLGVERVAVVPNGVSAPFRVARPLSDAERRRLGLLGSYVLHVGGATARKNLTGLAHAWRSVQPTLPGTSLVLVGPPDPRRDRAFAGTDEVITLGFRDPPTVAALMASALAVVVPSTYEGFGLPALEAMAAGAPVIAVRAGALPEVCGGAALLADPDPDGLADALTRVAGDAELRRRLVLAGRAHSREFTWERSAAGHLAAYDEAFN